MICISDKNLGAFGKELEAFKKIYERAFPDSNEREDWGAIVGRMADAERTPKTLIVLAQNEREEVVGGEIADWYPRSRALEIIYIAVAEDERKSGKGGALLMDGTKRMIEELGEGMVSRVYFESENPFFYANDADWAIHPVKRLRFFARHGAMRVPVAYVQPPLGPDKEPAHNLFLLTLPCFSSNEKSIPVQELQDFLNDFYEGLEGESSNTEERCQAFLALKQEMQRNVFYVADEDDKVYLDDLMERAGFCFEKFSICRHYELGGCDRLIENSPTTCRSFNSYETDLMNYQYQREMPFHTHHSALIENAVIHLPSFYCYESEGKSYYKISENKTVQADISINWSIKEHNGQRCVLAHLVVSPSENASHTEWDIIKFITQFGSKQENYQPWDRGKIEADGRMYSTMEELICARLEVSQCNCLSCGISEFNLMGITPLNEEKDGKYLYFEEFRQGIVGKGNGPENNALNRVMCGLLLGIFDFERMNASEIYDTLRIMFTRHNLLLFLCRGHLMSLKLGGAEDYERVPNILMSPYLIVPSAALLFNELTIARNQEKIRQEELREQEFEAKLKSSRKKGPKELLFNYFLNEDYYQRCLSISSSTAHIEEELSTWFMENIFQYESEQEILKAGMERRGISYRLGQMLRKVENLRKRNESYHDTYQNNINAIENILLFVLAVMEVTTAVLSDVLWLLSTTAVIVLMVGYFGFKYLERKRKL